MTQQERALVIECLALLEEAQGLINAAAAALCSVNGFAKEWSQHDKPYEEVKALWYRIVHRRSQLVKAANAAAGLSNDAPSTTPNPSK